MLRRTIVRITDRIPITTLLTFHIIIMAVDVFIVGATCVASGEALGAALNLIVSVDFEFEPRFADVCF
jgi:hypothetical protein